MANTFYTILSGLKARLIDWGDDHWGQHIGVTPVSPTGVLQTSFPISNAVEGATTDEPLAGETAEDATARTSISLWKRMVNKLVEIKALLPTALAAGGGLKVSGVAITTPTHTTATVTTVTGAALAANANRLYALFVNDSDTTIYLKLGVAAIANQGIRLNPNGGSYEMSAMYGNLYTGAINAIHAGTGNKVLTVLEGV